MAGKSSFVQKLGSVVKEVAAKKGSSWWYTPHMAAASRAIAQRIPLVDLVLEVRDARIPLSSEYEHQQSFPSSQRRIIVLNKMDLANRSEIVDWMTYFEQQNCIPFGVNSHNKENIKEFLNFLQGRVRQLKRTDKSGHTITALVIGIPNVGKSALVNSLHQIGRISAAEKGKLKHATVSPQPGETKDISSLKIASHPNIYVLDTPGILPPEISDPKVCAKLALTGAIADCLAGETELAQYFLSILNLSDEYKNWAKFSTTENSRSFIDQGREGSSSSVLDKRQKRQSPRDYTQDFVVNHVRGTLFDAISSFDGNVQDETKLISLIEAQLMALREIFLLPLDSNKDILHCQVATKLINLYRTGRLGHYTLDRLPRI